MHKDSNKMTLLFLACVDLSDPYSGIARKVQTEYKVFCKAFESVLVGYYKDGITIFRSGQHEIIQNDGRHRRLMLFDMAKNYMVNHHAQYVYIRRFPCNPLVIRLLSHLKKEGAMKILWEIPTYPYDHEHDDYKFNLYTKIVDLSDRLFRRRLKKYVNRIVTFSHYTNIFGIETINTGNGIDTETIRPRTVTDSHGDLNMIAVAVLSNWHGYDRLIAGIANYYRGGGKRNVVFHLVGGGPCLSEYKQMASSLHVENNVIFYGFRNKEEVDQIYDKCNIAVESLGWHRSQVEMGTSLKTREYLAKGLPIIASSPMDIFPDGWKYAYYAPIDESPINIEEVVEFYDHLREQMSDQEMAERFRKICLEKWDMSITMQPIINYYLK